MATIGDILAKAFEGLGLAGYVFDITPEEQASALRELDMMLDQWEAEGIDLDYTPAGGDGNLSDMMTTPAWANAAIASNLSLALAPSFGKTASPQLLAQAKRGYNFAVAKTLKIPREVRSAVPIRGAGYRAVRRDINTLS